MGIFDKLFTGLAKAFSKKGVATTSKTASKVAATTRAAKAATAAGAATKVSGMATRTQIATKIAPEGYFKATAKQIATSAPVKFAGKAAAAGVIVGGGVLAAGVLGGKGLSSIGYGYRNLTDNRTPEEIRNDQLKNVAKENELTEDKVKILEDYVDFLTANGLDDSPGTRDIYDRYVMGGNQPATQAPTNFMQKNSGLLTVGILAAAGIGIYAITKQKKGGGQKSAKK